MFPMQWMWRLTAYILKFLWWLIKKYGLLALVVIYLLRGILFSGPVCRLLERQILQASGLKVKIERFAGSYFFGLSLHRIELVEANGMWQKASVEKIAVSYNIFAPFFGERIFAGITVEKPCLEVVAVDASDDPPPPPRKKMSLAGVDFAALMQNIPTLKLLDADLVWQDGQRKMELRQFTLQISPRRGHIAADKIALHSMVEQEACYEIKELHCAWQYAEKVLTIHRLQLAMSGYDEPFVMRDPLAIDLSLRNIRLRDFCLSLPKGASLKGFVDASRGCHLELDYFPITFLEMQPLLVWFFRLSNSCQAELATAFRFDLPDWDLNRLRLQLALSLHRPRQRVELPLTDQEGISLLLRVEDLRLMSEIAACFGRPLPVDVAGSLTSFHHLRWNDDGVRLAGTLDLPRLATPYVPPLPVHARWQLASDWAGERIVLPNFELETTGARLAMQAQASRQPHWQCSSSGRLTLSRLSPLLPEQIARQLDAAGKLEWQLSASLPATPESAGKPDLQGNLSLQVETLALAGRSWRDIACQTDFAVTADQWQVATLTAGWRGQKLLTAGGSGGLLPGAPFRANARLEIAEISSCLRELVPQLAEVVSGQLTAEVEGAGVLPPPGKLPQLRAGIDVQLRDASLWGTTAPLLRLAGRVRGDENGAELERLQAWWQAEELLACSAAWRRDGQSKCSLKFAVSDMAKKIPGLNPPAGIVWPRLIEGSLACQGDVNRLADRPLDVELKLALSDGALPAHPYRRLTLAASAKPGLDRVSWDNIELRVDEDAMFSCSGKLSWKGRLTPDVDGRFRLAEIGRWLPKSQVGGSLDGKFAVRGNVPLAAAELDKWQLQAKMSLAHSGCRIGELVCPPLRLATRVMLAHNRLTLQQCELRDARNRLLHVLGTLQMDSGEANANVKLCVPDVARYLREVFPGKQTDGKEIVAGDVETTLALTARLPLKGGDYQSSGEWGVQWNKAAVGGKKYGDCRLNASFHHSRERVDVDRLTVELGQHKLLSLTAQVPLLPGGRCRCDGRFDIGDIARLLPAGLGDAVAGVVEARWTVSGELPGTHWRGPLAVKFDAAINNGRLGSLACRQLSFCTDIEADARTVVCRQFDVSYEQMPVLKMQGRIGLADTPTSIRLTVPALGSLAHKLPSLPPQLTWRGDVGLQAAVDGTLSLEQRSFDLTLTLATALSAPDNAYGMCRWQGMAVEWRGRDNKDGLEVKLRAQGKLANPQVSGDVRFGCYKYKLPALDMNMRDIACRLQVTPSRLSLDCGLLVGGSPLTLKGDIDYRDLWPQALAFHVQGKRLLLVRSETLYSRADIDLRLTGQLKRQADGKPKFSGKLAGTIDVTEMKVTVGISLEGSGERVKLAPNFESPFVDLDLDVRMNFPKILVNNNLMKIETSGNLTMAGSLENPRCTAWFRTDSGKLFLPQGVMNINECIVRLKPEEPFQPYLDVKAETRVRDYRVFVVIQGKPGDITIEFSSLPPLPKEDVLLLLMTGATQSELSQGASEKLKETGSSILMQQFLNYLGIGDYVSMQLSEVSTTITVTPPEWKGFAVQGKVLQEGKVRFHVIYRIEFK